MPKNKARLVEIIIQHLLEINAGTCSITEKHILNEEDKALQEILTGLLFLHQDLIFKQTTRQQAQAEHHQLEAQLRQSQKMEALGTLAGGIAHDFNNILGMILGNTELLMAKLPASSKEMKNLTSLSKAVERGTNLVEQILTFGRMTKATLKPVNISFIIKESLKMLRATIPANIEIQQDIETNGGQIMADITQIHQVVVNLCTNAFHAMQKNNGVLKVTLKQLDTCPPSLDSNDGACLRLSIADTGHGIPLENQEKIFDPFFTTKDVGKGTGLGLAVVHGVIKSHKGQIVVESEIGKGTTFQVYFPVAQEQAAPREITRDKPAKKGTGHILIVEDELILVEMYQEFFEDLGYNVTLAHNGSEALKLFEKYPSHYDVVFTDDAMPHITGKQLSQKLLKMRPNLPIILASGNGVITKEEAQIIGIRKYITKPFKLKTLSQMIEECL